MAKFAIQTLEFDKVKEMLAGKTATSLGRERVMNMRIESDFASVKRLQEETAEALRLLDDGKRFPFGGARQRFRAGRINAGRHNLRSLAHG